MRWHACTLDLRLIGGSAVFGVGWGMVGFCPGPAISSLAYLLPQSLVFVVAMLAGAGKDAIGGGAAATTGAGPGIGRRGLIASWLGLQRSRSRTGERR